MPSVDLNAASVDEIAAIPGVNRNAAKAIVEDRERRGPFKNMKAVGWVSGVGPKTLAALESAAFVGEVQFPIDINSAPASWLALARGVSRELGKQIAAHRPFAKMDDLKRVPGVGPAKVAALKEIAAVLSDGDKADDVRADLPFSRADVVLIRFRAEDDGSVTKVIPDAGLEEPFHDPYPHDRRQLLDALQRSVVPASFDPDYQASVGNELTTALVSQDPAGSPLDRVLYEAGTAAGKGQPVTLQLAFDEGAFTAAQLPWEILHDADGPVLAAERLRLNRHITYFGDRGPFEQVDPLRILYLESRPKDAGKLPDLTGDYLDAVDRLGARIRTRLIRHATFADLESALRSDEYHIVHYDGHGSFDGTGGYLLFEDGSRGTDWVTASRLAAALDGSGVRLVVLAACQGSTVGGMGLFQSTAPALIRAGVPAVVANQFSVYVDAEKEFTYAFYASLVRGESISAAVADGRTAMAPVRGHYFLPTLYLRVADGEGYLFGGEPETHRRWRMTEMQKLAAWWYGLSAVQQALYLEGMLRWQGQPVQPAPMPSPSPAPPDATPPEPERGGQPEREPRQEDRPGESKPRGSTPKPATPREEEWSPVGLWRIVGEPSTGDITGDDETGYVSVILTARPYPGFESTVGTVGTRFRRTGPHTFEGEQGWSVIGSGENMGFAPCTIEMTDPDTMVTSGGPPGQPWAVQTTISKRVGREVVDELIEQGYGGREEEERPEASVTIKRFWYAGSHAGQPCFHAEIDAAGLQNTELRAGVFVTDENGKMVTNNGDVKYYTPDGQLTVQLNLTPEYANTKFPEVEFTIPFNQFYEGRFTYDATLQIWRRVGSERGETLARAELPGTFWVDRKS